MTSKRRRQLTIILFLMLITSITDIMSIGAIIPFLAVLTTPEAFYANTTAQFFITFFNISSINSLLFAVTFGFCSLALIAGSLRLVLLWFITRISFEVGADLSLSIFNRTLLQPYSVHCLRNSSEVISGITNKASTLTHNIIVPFLTMMSSMTLVCLVLAVLVYAEPLLACLLVGFFGISYLSLALALKKRLESNSSVIAKEADSLIKTLQEGLGGIRELLLDNNQSTYVRMYGKSDRALRRAQANSAFIGGSPRYVLETVGIILISLIALLVSKEAGDLQNSLPVLGLFVLGAQRLLPNLQQSYGAWSSIKAGQVSLSDTLDLLNQKIFEPEKNDKVQLMSFNNSITFENVKFSYLPEMPLILDGFNISINKGDRVGFFGETGSGKSTTVDLLMGLLFPVQGKILIDGQVLTLENVSDWQQKISHVPQSIFLADASIEQNIAFGIEPELIDRVKVVEAAQQAKIHDFIDELKEKYETEVGERGVRLSGGQLQRIGIARALYKKSSVVIFDEATSSLDSTTENYVMEAIGELSSELTVIVVAHRLTTLMGCNKVVEMEGGRVKQIASYAEVFGTE